jgi:hypothetical protein
MSFPGVVNFAALTDAGIGLPWSIFRRGFGSNESTAETPPDMKQKITLFTRAGKWGGFAASGLAAELFFDDTVSLPNAPRPSNADNATIPKPVDACVSSSRRDNVA